MDAGLKVAFLGKGGAGKSMIAGTLCRHLARRGYPVLAFDVDTVPGLSMSLKVPADAGRLPTGLARIIETKKGRRWKVQKGGGPAHLVDSYAVKAADGVRFLALGNLPAEVEPSVSVAFRQVMERFRRPGWALVADLAAGTRQPMFGWAGFALSRILVVEPSAKSLLTARRLAPVATHIVANKVDSPSELRVVRENIDLPVLGVIPFDESVIEAESRGIAPIDFAPGSPAVAAVAEIAKQLEETYEDSGDRKRWNR